MDKIKILCGFILLLATGVSAGADKDSDGSPTPTLEQKPRWELGLGGGYIDDFDYPASRDPNRAGLVLPFFIYRGSSMRFSGRNVSAVALEDPRFRLDFSIGAALNANSDGNNAREGMPDLDFLIEFGPQLVMRLLDRDWMGGRSLVNWRNRIRAVFSTDFGSINSRGWIFQSQLQWTQRRLLSYRKLDALALLNLTWATEKMHDYFYQVDPEFETPTRPRFDASGGFLGANLFTGLAYRPVPRLRLFGGIRQGYFGGAANENSPLFETRSSTGFAIGLVWTIRQSEDTVGIMDDE